MAVYVSSASLQRADRCLDHFLSNGVTHIPVVLQPSADSTTNLKNPNLIFQYLQDVTPLYTEITEVNKFGKSGIVCKSRNMDCVAELLKCSSFAGQPVRPFIVLNLYLRKAYFTTVKLVFVDNAPYGWLTQIQRVTYVMR